MGYSDIIPNTPYAIPAPLREKAEEEFMNYGRDR
jgi:hypothetical protein